MYNVQSIAAISTGAQTNALTNMAYVTMSSGPTTRLKQKQVMCVLHVLICFYVPDFSSYPEEFSLEELGLRQALARLSLAEKSCLMCSYKGKLYGI